MSIVCAGDVVDRVGTPVVINEDSTVRIANINHAEIGKDGVTTGGEEIHIKQAGVRDVEGDTGENHCSSCVGDYCDEMSAISPAAKVNGRENTSNSDDRNRTTSETWTAENTEDDCIVDFLDKSNEKVCLSLSHP
jgi:hypothetical protein